MKFIILIEGYMVNKISYSPYRCVVVEKIIFFILYLYAITLYIYFGHRVKIYTPADMECKILIEDFLVNIFMKSAFGTSGLIQWTMNFTIYNPLTIEMLHIKIGNNWPCNFKEEN